jgi:pilus assembly protein FimV
MSADKAASGSGRKVTVQPGETAGRIAAQHKPASVSLDQMLVALLLSNPDAFIGGNVNRLKAGAVLELPGADQAGATPAAEARRTIVAQSADFNAFRRKLAEGAPATRVAGADRQAAGQVQAKVEDKAPSAATPDKLTLSKGELQSKAAAEEKIARERQDKEAAARVAELQKNISELNKLGSAPASPAAPGPAAAASPPLPGLALVKPAELPAGLPAVAASAAVPGPASSQVVAATTPATSSAAALPAAPPVVAPVAAASAAAAAPAKKPLVTAPPKAEPSLIDELLENPLVLVGGAGLLLLLAAFGLYQARRRSNAVAVDSSFLESRLQPDSFFGASGGQRIDTNEAGVTGSSMVYSPSQLDAAGDVDPVAEADVYLAYGRDLQAEEILKEAIRVSPTRVAIHAKLMEIYAKRRDAKAFEMVATEAFSLTKGQGIEWAHMAEMGRDLDPANPMYKPDGRPPSVSANGAARAGADAAAFAASTLPQALAPAPAPAAAATALDFDLDLDFSLDDEPVTPAPLAARIESPVAMPAVAAAPATDNNLDFSQVTMAMPSVAPPPPKAAPPLEAGGLSFTTTEPAAITTAASPLAATDGMLEFDLGDLSLDLDTPPTESPKITETRPVSSGIEDPLETKFALAEEFRAIGDVDGARSLAEEVLAQASGSLKSKAQAFLNSLS